MKRWLKYILPLIVALIGCHHSTSIESKSFFKIVFLSNREAPKRHFDIFIMNANGSQQINLTPGLQSIRTLSNPILSPDGRKVLFVAFEKSGISLQLLNLEDKRITRVVNVNYDVPQASFCKDGHKILFVRKVDGRRQIFSIWVDGTAERCLSDFEDDEFSPVFSMDGKKIAFISKYDGVYRLCIMDSNGLNRRIIAEGHNKIESPVFSPDGDIVAFCGYEGQISDIYTIKSTGGKAKNLTKDKYWDYSPIFSPDGSKIAFISHRRGFKYSDICIMDSKGHHFKNLTQQLNDINQHPVFTPDGKSIVFESITFNDSDIYRYDIHKGKLINLTHHKGWDQSPSL